MPLPVDIIQYLSRDIQAAAQSAWNKVVNAVDEFGCGKSVVFDDALIHSVIEDMGGWQAMGKLSKPNLPNHAKDFEQHYIRYLQQPPQTYPRILKGYIDLRNEADGYSHRALIGFVGDKQKAQQVMKKGGDASNACHFHVVTREVVSLQNSSGQSPSLSSPCRLSSATDDSELISYDLRSEESKKVQVN